MFARPAGTALIPTPLELAAAYAVTRHATLMTPLLDSETLRLAAELPDVG